MQEAHVEHLIGSAQRGVAAPPSLKPLRLSALSRPARATSRIAWRYAAPIVALHAMAISCLFPWLFSWTGVMLFIAGVYFYGGLGVNIGYHRLLTHRSFACPLWLERTFTVIAICCLEDAPGSWVTAHRMHHNEADESPDPHSPLVSFLWSHVGWLLVENREVRCAAAYDRYARDVLRDPFYFRLQRTLLPLWIYLAHALLYFAGGLAGGWLATGDAARAFQLGLSAVAWGVILRTVVVWHITWSVNSLTHLFGYRNYETGENSRNNWFVALLTSGEGWHNNHHADAASASNSHRWWELDPMYGVIRALELCGLAHDVIRPRCRRRG
jgi:stearoyl-CoA desaturase (delta-9 desaturase)